MATENYPNAINYPEIKPDDTDQIIRERCFIYIKGNRNINPKYLNYFTREADRLFEYIKTGTITSPSYADKDKS